jgi:hypothetical protein
MEHGERQQRSTVLDRLKVFHLRESGASYGGHLGSENDDIGAENGYFCGTIIVRFQYDDLARPRCPMARPPLYIVTHLRQPKNNERPYVAVLDD